MPLNIKDPETERLAAEVAALAGETKTQAVRTALRERRDRLSLAGAPGLRRDRVLRFLEQEVWPQVPPGALGRPVTREERETLLGYGRSGV